MPTVQPTKRTTSARSRTDLTTRNRIAPQFEVTRRVQWVVERLDNDGEELPVVRHTETWLPARLALHYLFRLRFAVGPEQLRTDMGAIALLYDWSEKSEGIGELEKFLTSGKFLSVQQLKQLAYHLHHRQGVDSSSSVNKNQDKSLVSNQTYNKRLFAIQEFLRWAYEPTNHGGVARCSLDEIERQKTIMCSTLEDEKLEIGESRRHEPLTVEVIKLIRRAIGPNRFGEFPTDVFDEVTRYRNWLMFEMALNLGTRLGELLTIKGEHLFKGNKPHQIFIPRQQDEAGDPRTNRRLRGKTTARVVPLMDPNLLPVILKYFNSDLPAGHRARYLFLTEDKRPISNSTAQYIIKQIKRYAERLLETDDTLDAEMHERCRENLRKLCWHRLRTTWAEITALWLYRKHGESAWWILKEWGGWSNGDSMERYIEDARRTLSEEASVECLDERFMEYPNE